MEEIKFYRAQETKRFLNWITENYDLWEKICNANSEPKWEEIKVTVKTLIKNSFYDVLILYISMYWYGYNFSTVMNKCKMKYLVGTWNEDNAEKLFDNIVFELDNFNSEEPIDDEPIDDEL